MREIKFRAKVGLSPHWYHGSLVQKSYIDEDDELRTVSYIVDDLPISKTPEGRVFKCEVVDSSTVSQYTGLKDKDGHEIYEGDILRGNFYPFTGHKGRDNILGVVFCTGAGGFQIKQFPTRWYEHRRNSNFYNTLCDIDLDKMEVIGNLWDNKEMFLESDERIMEWYKQH